MASKATHRKTTVDVIKQQKKNAKRLAGQARQSASGVSAAASSTTSLAPSSQGSSAGANIAAYLRTAGDTMIGPLAFWRGANTSIYPSSSNNNTMDISSATGSYSSHVIWFAGGSNTLEIISGAAFNGQILFLESTQSLTQTIKDRSNTSGGNTGNIKTLDGNDLALGTDKTIVLLMYSDVDSLWHQVSNPAGGGSGATRELDNLQNTAVNADIIPASASSVDLGSLTKPYDRTYSDEVVFVTEGAISTNKPTIGWGNSTRGMTFSMHNLGSTQNAWTWEENGTTKMTLSNGGMLTVGTMVSTTLLRAEGDIELGNATSDDLTITARVDSDVIPKTTQSHDLGDTDRWWDKLYSMYVYTNRISLSGTNAQIDMNNYPIMECGDIDFNGTESIKRSGTEQLEFTSAQIVVHRPTSVEADMTMASAYFNPGNVTTGAASGTAKFFYVKVPDSGASGWAYAKVPCYT